MYKNLHLNVLFNCPDCCVSLNNTIFFWKYNTYTVTTVFSAKLVQAYSCVMDSYLPQIDSTWILYNKPKGNELTNEYAGFLMALGLNEHLIHLHSLNVHDYLSKVRVPKKYKLTNETNSNNLSIHIVDV